MEKGNAFSEIKFAGNYTLAGKENEEDQEMTIFLWDDYFSFFDNISHVSSIGIAKELCQHWNMGNQFFNFLLVLHLINLL